MFKKENEYTANALVTRQADNRNIGVIQFLDAYERQADLWNPNSENYKNKLARDEAYLKIIEDLNMPNLSVNDVKLKVKSIRTSYKKELRMFNKNKEEGKNAQKKLQNEESATFVLDFVKTTNTAEEIVECSGTCSPNIETQSQNDLSTLDYRRSEDAPLMAKLSYTSSDTTVTTHLHDHITTTAAPSTSEPNCRTKNETVPACKNVALDDEYDLFCRSVAVQLRSIRDNYSRSVAKLKIQQILFEAETGHYRSTACVTIPVSQNLTTL